MYLYSSLACGVYSAQIFHNFGLADMAVGWEGTKVPELVDEEEGFIYTVCIALSFLGYTQESALFFFNGLGFFLNFSLGGYSFRTERYKKSRARRRRRRFYISV